SLEGNLDSVFLENSNESIWQLQQNNSSSPYYNVTPEGYQIIPGINRPPFAFLTTYMVNNFDSGDLRRVVWIDSTVYNNEIYYFPYKYKQGRDPAIADGT